jgi:AraC family transcriptional regulator of adaptative response/methylated-DNA-[protein]-cysteine methyltransferase
MKAAQQSLFDHEFGLSNQRVKPADFINIIEFNTDDSVDTENFQIEYSFHISPFGEILIASTDKGICFVWFADDQPSAIAELEKRFPLAQFEHKAANCQQEVMHFFNNDSATWPRINLHLKGTEFQIKVWKAVLEIPLGKLTNYIEIAKEINQPNASRAVGTAIGKNPIALLIPCHRVVQTNGQLGGYRWGLERKASIIKWELGSK